MEVAVTGNDSGNAVPSRRSGRKMGTGILCDRRQPSRATSRTASPSARGTLGTTCPHFSPHGRAGTWLGSPRRQVNERFQVFYGQATTALMETEMPEISRFFGIVIRM